MKNAVRPASPQPGQKITRIGQQSQKGKQMPVYNILLMGASYGSLLASKMLFGGHSIHLVCLPAEADLINAEGFRVRLPVRGRKDPVELNSRDLPGKITAGGAAGVNPGEYDLIGLAMQEPQY